MSHLPGALARAAISAAVFMAFFLMLFPAAHAEGRHWHHWRHAHHHRLHRGSHEFGAAPTASFAERAAEQVERGYAQTFATERGRASRVKLLKSAERFPTDVLREAARYLGDGNITGHRGPWCRFFVNMILRNTGHRYNSDGTAWSARYLGPGTGPHPGAIAYTWHHTGFVARVDFERGRVLLLGGNQSHRVSLKWHSMRGMRFVEPI